MWEYVLQAIGRGNTWCEEVELVSNLYERLQSKLKSNWQQKLDRIDFQSGLGDSAWLLYGFCRSMKPLVAVEIGSARGKSACYIGMALKHNGSGRLYAIDPHTSTNWNDNNSVDTYNIMRRNLEVLHLTDVVTVLREYSSAALRKVPKPIDVLFIDGDHSYEGVKADWDNFTPHMAPFGLIVFHDTIWGLKPDSKWYRQDMGVPRFVDELRRSGYPVITVDRDCGVSVVQQQRNGISLIP
jgi:predicted O-methyltransferase YrrM